jgi:hypothetical protein
VLHVPRRAGRVRVPGEEGVIELYTSHWRSPLLREVAATIIGISRGTPRGNPGFAYRVLRSLAPSRRTFAIADRERFEAAYRAQLEEIGAEHILAELERIAGNGAAILLCWERLADPSEWCHRRMLADFIERETGQEVPELQAGMLRKRPDAPQPALFDELPREEEG